MKAKLFDDFADFLIHRSAFFHISLKLRTTLKNCIVKNSLSFCIYTFHTQDLDLMNSDQKKEHPSSNDAYQNNTIKKHSTSEIMSTTPHICYRGTKKIFTSSRAFLADNDQNSENNLEFSNQLSENGNPIFVLPSLRCILRVSEEILQFYDMQGIGRECLLSVKWTKNLKFQNDRIVTVASMLAPGIFPDENSLISATPMLLIFTASGQVLPYVFERSTSRSKAEMCDNLIVLQQRINSYCNTDPASKQLPGAKSGSDQSPFPVRGGEFFIDNPRAAVFGDLSHKRFEKRSFALPNFDHLLHGCDSISYIELRPFNSNIFSHSCDLLRDLVSKIKHLGEGSENVGQDNKFILDLRDGEYVSKVIQHVPTRAILLLTKSAFRSEAKANSIYQLIFSNATRRGGIREMYGHLVECSPRNRSFNCLIKALKETTVRCAAQAQSGLHAMWTLREQQGVEKPPKKRKCDEVPSRKTVENLLSCFEDRMKSTVAVFPPLFFSSSTLPPKKETFRLNEFILDVAIDDSRDYLYILRTKSTIEVFDIANAGWDDAYAPRARNSNLQFVHMTTIKHEDHLLAMGSQSHISEHGRDDELMAITIASSAESQHTLGKYSKVYEPENIELLFSVHTTNKTFQYGLFIDARHTSQNLRTAESFQIVLANTILYFGDNSPSHIPYVGQTFPSAICNASVRETQEKSLTTSTYLWTSRMKDMQSLKYATIIDSVLSRNFYHMKTRATLRPFRFSEKCMYKKSLLLRLAENRISSQIQGNTFFYKENQDRLKMTLYQLMSKYIHLVSDQHTHEINSHEFRKFSEMIFQLNTFALENTELAKNLFYFELQCFLAGTRSTDSVVDLLKMGVDKEYLTSTFFDIRFVRSLKKNQSIDLSSGWTKITYPSCMQAMLFQTIEIISPLLSIRLFQNRCDQKLLKAWHSADYIAPISSEEIRAIILSLNGVLDIATGLIDESYINSTSQALKLPAIQDISSAVIEVQITPSSRFVDYEGALIMSMQKIAKSVAHINQKLCFLEYIYTHFGTYFEVHPTSQCGFESYTISLVNIWRCLFDACETRTPAEPSTQQILFDDFSLGHLFAEGWLLTAESYTLITAKSFLMTFVRAVFLFSAIESALTLAEHLGSVSIYKPKSFVGTKDLCLLLENVFKDDGSLFNRCDESEINLLKKFDAINRHHAALLLQTSPVSWSTIKDIESTLTARCDAFFNSGSTLECSSIANIFFHCCISASIKDLLVLHSSSRVSPFNFFSLGAILTVSIRRSLPALPTKNILGNVNDDHHDISSKSSVFWSLLTLYCLHDIESAARVSFYPNSGLGDFSTPDTPAKVCLALEGFMPFQFILARTKHLLRQKDPRRQIHEHTQLENSLLKIFSVSDSDLVERDSALFKRLLSWATLDLTEWYGSLYARNEDSCYMLQKYRRSMYKSLCEGIRCRSTNVQQVLLKQCEAFLMSHKDKMPEEITDFFSFSAKDLPFQVPQSNAPV